MKTTPIYGASNTTGNAFEAFLRCLDFLKTNNLINSIEPSDAVFEVLSTNEYIPYISKNRKSISFVNRAVPLETLVALSSYVFLSSDYRFSFVIILSER